MVSGHQMWEIWGEEHCREKGGRPSLEARKEVAGEKKSLNSSERSGKIWRKR